MSYGKEEIMTEKKKIVADLLGSFWQSACWSFFWDGSTEDRKSI